MYPTEKYAVSASSTAPTYFCEEKQEDHTAAVPNSQGDNPNSNPDPSVQSRIAIVTGFDVKGVYTYHTVLRTAAVRSTREGIILLGKTDIPKKNPNAKQIVVTLMYQVLYVLYYKYCSG